MLDRIKKEVNKYENDIINGIMELVRIPSVEGQPLENMPFGLYPTKALEKALEMADKLGFKTVNLDNYCGYCEYGQGEEIIGLLGHLDIVPEGDNWDTNPFEPVIIDGKMYGRGVSDNKSPMVCSLYALKALVDMDVKFNKRVRIIFGINEETHFKCMEHYVEVEEKLTWGFTPDGSFPGIHGEKGILQADIVNDNYDKSLDEFKILEINAGVAYNSICEKCKMVFESNNLQNDAEKLSSNLKEKDVKFDLKVEDDKCEITVYGVSGHASDPTAGLNAISHLFDALKDFENSFVKFFNKVVGLTSDGSKAGCKLSDSYGDLTMNIGKMTLSGKNAMFTMDIRYPISKKYEDVVDPINNSLKKSGFKFVEASHKGPLYYEQDALLVKTLYDSYVEVTQDFVNKPFTIGGGTYARAMDNIIAFGGGFPGEHTNAHNKNENVKIENFTKQAHIYALAIINLMKL